jgi:hypothetical protein
MNTSYSSGWPFKTGARHQTACSAMDSEITVLMPCVLKALNPSTISSYSVFSVGRYGSRFYGAWASTFLPLQRMTVWFHGGFICVRGLSRLVDGISIRFASWWPGVCGSSMMREFSMVVSCRPRS